MANTIDTQSPVSVKTLQKMRSEGEKITMLTAYDATFAHLLDSCGVDCLLVGDSLGMVIQGRATTLPVSLEDMAYHTACVARAVKRAIIAVDMPFGTFQESPQATFRNAVKLMAAGAQMIKLEGGAYLAETIAFLTDRGIPVCAHVGLTPQSVNRLGGFTVQGKTPDAKAQLFADAQACEGAGASLIVLEAVPAELGSAVTDSLTIPTIGIGAGPDCSGQVLVTHDMLGLGARKAPRFVKNFMNEAGTIAEAVTAYVAAVKSGDFPAPEHCFKS